MASDTVDEGSNFDLLDDFLSANIVPNESTDVHGKNESLKLSYMKSSENVLNFWKVRELSDAELYALSKICLAIPPTQVRIIT